MDVQSPLGDSGQHGRIARPSDAGALSRDRVGRALGEWQAGELRLARSFGECRGLSHEQLEDLYQETVVVLLGRSFLSDEHLRHALRWGIKHRALHIHRDERRREQILEERGAEIEHVAERRAAEHVPELAVVAQDDRMIVTEFFSELSELEQSMFWLMAEGLHYRAIAPVLHVPMNEARKAERSCETKRARFQLLYDTGRICGFRSQTIVAMQAGHAVDEELARRAYTHLARCSRCRSEHKTNAGRLRRSFQEQAAALSPIPILAGRLGWLAKLEMRLRSLQHRVAPYGSPPAGSGVRERTIAVLATGGAGAKVAAGVASVAVIAGGTIGANALEHSHARPHRHVEHAAAASARAPGYAPEQAGAVAGQTHTSAGGRSETERAGSTRAGEQREPGGFAYLGVPSSPDRAPRAGSASTDHIPSAERDNGVQAGRDGEQHGGGPFSP